MKPFSLFFCFLFLVGCTQERPALWEGTIIDLSHPYDSTTIYWPTEKGFVLERGTAGMTPGGFYYSANRFWTPEHGGTHLDAPIHFYEHRNTVDQIPVEQFVGPGIVVDVADECAVNRDYRVTIEDFGRWETRHGRIPDGAIVLLRTGFGAFWPDRKQYLGTDKRGPEAIPELHFPGLHPEAAKWIATERNIRLIGIDTPSIDYGQSTLFESHVALFGKNIPALENVAHLQQLPPKDFTVVALPMKIAGGSGGPVRIIAIVPQ
jgi:kynurenine formamidase